jgi:diguanylate cyclase
MTILALQSTNCASNSNSFIKQKADEAIHLLNQHHILPTPANYQVWFSYTADYDQNLKKTIDHLLNNNKQFTPGICHQIYHKFLSNDKENRKISDTGENLQIELDKIASHLKSSIRGTADINSNINNHVKELSTNITPSLLEATAENIINEVNELEARTLQTREELELSSTKIQKLQIELENARLESRTDILTSIGNRKLFDEAMAEAISNSKRKNVPFTVILGDIDHFKKFNDEWGHVTGDQVLKAVAYALKITVGTKGTPTRYGGEEFALILPNFHIEKGKILAEEIRKFISERSIKKLRTGEYVSKITMSFGVAEYKDNESVEAIVRRADTALYKAKEEGRNRVICETELN